MAKIVINSQQQCQIVDESDVDFLAKLDAELSFFVEGAQYSNIYKGYTDSHGKHHQWDGYKRLLTKDLKFSIGLLNRVKKLYNKLNKPIEILDLRPPANNSFSLNILPKLKEQGIEPYPYQFQAVQVAKENDRGIIRIGTGGGKSLIAALITAEFGKPTIIYVIGKDLLYQFHSLFCSLFDQEIGIVGDGNCIIKDINIVTVWTAGVALGFSVKKTEDEGDEKKIDPTKYNEIKDMLKRSKVHIIDECHLAACDTVQNLFKYISPEHIYGMSASPWRDDGSDLMIENFLGEKIIDLSARKLISGNYLVEPIIKFLTPDPYTGSKKSNYQTVYSEYVVNNENRNGMVVKGAIRLVEQGFKPLILFHSISHGKILSELIKKELKCELLSGKDNSKKRDRAKNKFEAGKIDCLIASKIFDIGLNLPFVSGLIIAGSGKSSVRSLQRIGRVIRKYDGKDMAAVLDFADKCKYLDKHAKIRRDIYKEEFDKVSWPEKENKNQ